MKSVWATLWRPARRLHMLYVALPALLLAACAQHPRAPELESHADASLRTCEHQLEQHLQDLRARRALDAQAWPVPGYPYLRSTRLLAEIGRTDLDSQQLRAWLMALAEQASEAYAVESPRRESGPTPQQLSTCARQLAAALAGQPIAAEAARRAALRIPDAYSTSARWLGLYPFASHFARPRILAEQAERRAAFGSSTGPVVIWRMTASDETDSAATPTEIAARTSLDELGRRQFQRNDLHALLQRYAPEIAIEQASDDDRLIALSTRSPGDIDSLSGSAHLHWQLEHTLWREQVLPQLIYHLWFPRRTAMSRFDPVAGRLDGLILRVTLDAQLQPLIVDIVHACGCWHAALPGPSLRARPVADRDEPLNVLGDLPMPDGDQVWRLRVGAGHHHVLGLDLHPRHAAITDLQAYQLRAYTKLRAAWNAHTNRGWFDDAGLMHGTQRLERYWLWPFGVREAGTLRQWGQHPTAFIGRRHLDDARWIERYFEPDS